MSLGLLVCRLVVAKAVSVIRRSRARKTPRGLRDGQAPPTEAGLCDRESSEGGATEKGRVFLVQEVQTKTWWRTRSAQQDSVWPTGSLRKHHGQKPNEALYNPPNVCLLKFQGFFFSNFFCFCARSQQCICVMKCKTIMQQSDRMGIKLGQGFFLPLSKSFLSHFSICVLNGVLHK